MRPHDSHASLALPSPCIYGVADPGKLSWEQIVRDLKLPSERHPEKAHRPDNSQPRKPDWIRVKAPTSAGYKQTRDILRTNKLVTVCEEAGCPNVGECWSAGHATMMIMGEICTRGCSFCNVATGKPDAARRVRTGPCRPCGRDAGAEACRHYQRPIATTWRMAARSISPRQSARSATGRPARRSRY